MSYFENWMKWVTQRKNKEIGAMEILVDNRMNIIDSKDIEKKIVGLKKELDTLMKLGNDYIDGGGESGVWANGVELVRDSFFLEHIKGAAVESLDVDLSIWPFCFIDWKAVAEDFKRGYFSIDFNGVTYWIKRPPSIHRDS